ncbi:MAG: phosphoribosylaminoimidazolesuccinocarboxamide synthase [Desulfovibrionaceae bacterium]|nr:phosphoribosylaminoimidazolesuccinocarboxamide synthase [Desulfovibrionaceae bacterium]MBF0514798.1 phosphoribosylaminoimidazolesuccinocarboxamide synthase [Desulfovibrionaceae bacterium]
MQTVFETNIPEYPLLSRGKVRDIYEVSPDELLIVTTDRLSAYDVVMPDPIPLKGVILNQITIFWMDMVKDIVGNHLLAVDVNDFPAKVRRHAGELKGRAVLAKRAAPLPIECIVRGYITGSGWKDYQKTGQICGQVLPEGLLLSQKLDTPLFTPSTKAAIGLHDENISLHKAEELCGSENFRQARDITLAVYARARDYAATRGILIADTKFEFGLINGAFTLIDEALTPDSSRFWPSAGYAPGRDQPSFDKQYVRDYLTGAGFDKKPPAPRLPKGVIEKTKEKYLEAFAALTGKSLAY